MPDNPIQIADAALYLMKTKPSLGITDPYELNKTQFNAAIDLLKQQKPLIKKYWAPRLGRDRPVQERRRRDRRLVAVPDEHAPGRQGAGEGPRAEGGRDGLARHLDGLREDEEPRLRLQVAGVDLDAEGAGAAGRLLRRDAREQARLRGDGQARQGLVRASTTPTPRSRTSRRSTSGRRRSPTAATARRTAWTTRSGSRPGPASRAERASGRSAPPSRRRALAPPAG